MQNWGYGIIISQNRKVCTATSYFTTSKLYQDFKKDICIPSRKIRKQKETKGVNFLGQGIGLHWYVYTCKIDGGENLRSLFFCSSKTTRKDVERA